MPQSTSRVGKRGTVVIPVALRRRFGIEEGSLVIVAEDREEGILIHPTLAVSLESYTPDRRAKFLLSNAVSGEDYPCAEEEVRKMGLDPAAIAHHKP